MISLLEHLRKMRRTGDPAPLVEIIPYLGFLGISMGTSGEEIIGKLSFGEHLIGNSLLPALHGGTVGALLESTAIFTLLLKAETLRVPKTINITVEYLRTGHPQDTFARAEFTKIGRRIASVRAFAWQEERQRPIAAANAHFLLRPTDDDETPSL